MLILPTLLVFFGIILSSASIVYNETHYNENGSGEFYGFEHTEYSVTMTNRLEHPEYPENSEPLEIPKAQEPPQPNVCLSLEETLMQKGCQPISSCQRNGNHDLLFSHPTYMSSQDFEKTSCFCDPECKKFGDCCFDVVELQNEPVKDSWNCKFLPGPKVNIYMIASCPPDWPDQQEVARCERRVSDDQYRYILDIPVFSNKTGKPYANMYCARCHQDAYLLPLQVTLKCPLRNFTDCKELSNHAHYLHGQAQWQVYSKYLYGKFVWLHVLDYEGGKWIDYPLYPPRRCHPVIDTCPQEKLEYQQNCSYYASYIRYNDGLYKNIYCALCNSLNLSLSVKCSDYYYDNNRLYYGPNCTELEKKVKRPKYLFQLDFQNPVGHSPFGSQVRCLVGETYDPLTAKCLSFLCKEKLQSLNGECVNVSSDVIDGTKSTMNDNQFVKTTMKITNNEARAWLDIRAMFPALIAVLAFRQVVMDY